MRFICIAFITFNLVCKAQINNLVPNQSFENYLTCPDNHSQIILAEPWFVPTLNLISSDYFNTCNQDFVVDIPSNFTGYQLPQNGNAYSGIFCYCLDACVPNENYREYIEVKLISPLSEGKKYCMNMYVSLADSSAYAINKLGAYFSIDSVLANDNYVLPLLPQVSSDTNIIRDTSDWVLIEGNYTAIGGEQFLTIGNFNDDVNTEFVLVDSSKTGLWTYYYFDNITVYLCDDTLPEDPKEIKIPNVFTPDNDEFNDLFVIENLTEGASVQVYNRWGALIFESNSPNNFWDGRTKGGTPVPGGIYYYVVKIPGSESKKGFVEVIR